MPVNAETSLSLSYPWSVICTCYGKIDWEKNITEGAFGLLEEAYQSWSVTGLLIC